MNRQVKQLGAIEQKVVKLFAEIAIGATGAPTLTSGQGVTSISRTSAGLYVLTLQETYQRLLSFNCNPLLATAEDLYAKLKARDVASAKTITFFTLTAATATDPADGSVLFIELSLKNSGVV